jgi:hypothetical protein
MRVQYHQQRFEFGAAEMWLDFNQNWQGVCIANSVVIYNARPFDQPQPRSFTNELYHDIAERHSTLA